MVGLAAALRLAETEVVVVLPTDMPFMTAGLLRALADAAEGVDVALPRPARCRARTATPRFPSSSRRIASGDLALHQALRDLETRVVELDEAALRNVNDPAELHGL